MVPIHFSFSNILSLQFDYLQFDFSSDWNIGRNFRQKLSPPPHGRRPLREHDAGLDVQKSTFGKSGFGRKPRRNAGSVSPIELIFRHFFAFYIEIYEFRKIGDSFLSCLLANMFLKKVWSLGQVVKADDSRLKGRVFKTRNYLADQSFGPITSYHNIGYK